MKVCYEYKTLTSKQICVSVYTPIHIYAHAWRRSNKNCFQNILFYFVFSDSYISSRKQKSPFSLEIEFIRQL